MSSLTLSEDEARLFLNSLYLGHCTMALFTERNQVYRSLTDAYQRCFGELTAADVAHAPGQDAYKCARLFLHYNQAFVAIPKDDETETRHTKNAKVSRLLCLLCKTYLGRTSIEFLRGGSG